MVYTTIGKMLLVSGTSFRINTKAKSKAEYLLCTTEAYVGLMDHEEMQNTLDVGLSDRFTSVTARKDGTSWLPIRLPEPMVHGDLILVPLLVH